MEICDHTVQCLRSRVYRNTHRGSDILGRAVAKITQTWYIGNLSACLWLWWWGLLTTCVHKLANPLPFLHPSKTCVVACRDNTEPSSDNSLPGSPPSLRSDGEWSDWYAPVLSSWMLVRGLPALISPMFAACPATWYGEQGRPWGFRQVLRTRPWFAYSDVALCGRLVISRLIKIALEQAILRLVVVYRPQNGDTVQKLCNRLWFQWSEAFPLGGTAICFTVVSARWTLAFSCAFLLFGLIYFTLEAVLICHPCPQAAFKRKSGGD